ncbi:nuclear transport factor 2 family protein [Streptomyces sp. DG2A-72]|uniref:nuclear transport factor 2 family protein n=1 Tax=Streptomyces sp. DG2A-72 TaxID=3051386 RepID=UPI00265B7E8B|nr:nuclear transport factor 2 family protein [Streptomyces sp. DG2A-72]MDO0930317.1 nuclear transport factor 2 family protein [Streptomyces sp. DG2A-72]
MNQLHAYIDAWRRHDVVGVLGTLTDDCVIIESYGPVYRCRERVEQWMRAWFGAGGSVDSWEITWQGTTGEALIAEWIFSCTWQGKAATFEGATIARLEGEKIAYLREYATTAPLYDWTGTWRD